MSWRPVRWQRCVRDWRAFDERPKLLICDRRLRDGIDGVDVIATVRKEFGADLPALLITGDTAPDRLSDAQSVGFVLLHKPVQSGRLRAAIANLTRHADQDARGSAHS